MLSLFWFTLRQAFWARKFWLTLLLLLGPAAMTLLIRYLASPDELPEVWATFHGPIQMLLLPLVVPLICMFYGTALMGSEIEAKTLVYLVSRRLRRGTVFLARFVAVTVALVAFVQAALILQYLAATVGHDLEALKAAGDLNGLENWEPQADLQVYFRLAPLAVVVYFAVFTAVGTLLARPMAASVVYLLVVELLLGNSPLPLRSYSLLHQLRLEMVAAMPKIVEFFRVPDELRPTLFPEGDSGVLVIWVVVGIAVGVTFGRVSWWELLPTKVSRE